MPLDFLSLKGGGGSLTMGGTITLRALPDMVMEIFRPLFSNTDFVRLHPGEIATAILGKEIDMGQSTRSKGEAKIPTNFNTLPFTPSIHPFFSSSSCSVFPSSHATFPQRIAENSLNLDHYSSDTRSHVLIIRG